MSNNTALIHNAIMILTVLCTKSILLILCSRRIQEFKRDGGGGGGDWYDIGGVSHYS